MRVRAAAVTSRVGVRKVRSKHTHRSARRHVTLVCRAIVVFFPGHRGEHGIPAAQPWCATADGSGMPRVTPLEKKVTCTEQAWATISTGRCVVSRVLGKSRERVEESSKSRDGSKDMDEGVSNSTIKGAIWKIARKRNHSRAEVSDGSSELDWCDIHETRLPSQSYFEAYEEKLSDGLLYPETLPQVLSHWLKKINRNP